jgi:hypothetical protein
MFSKHVLIMRYRRAPGSYKWSNFVQLLLHQLRAVLTTDSEEIRTGGGFAGDLTYEESCNRLCLILGSFPGCPTPSLPLCGPTKRHLAPRTIRRGGVPVHDPRPLPQRSRRGDVLRTPPSSPGHAAPLPS